MKTTDQPSALVAPLLRSGQLIRHRALGVVFPLSVRHRMGLIRFVDRHEFPMSEQATRVLLRLIEAVLNGSNDPELLEDEISSHDWLTISASARQHLLSGLAPFVYGGLSLSQAILPSKELKRAMETLETEVQPRQRQRFREQQVARLLSPSPESAFGSPWSRFLMTPSFKYMLSLVHETLSPCVSKRSPFLSAFARRMTLINRHGFSRWSRSLWSARTAVRTET